MRRKNFYLGCSVLPAIAGIGCATRGDASVSCCPVEPIGSWQGPAVEHEDIAGPGSISSLLTAALAARDVRCLLIDRSLAAALLVGDLHALVAVGELERVDLLAKALRPWPAGDAAGVRPIVTVARHLLSSARGGEAPTGPEGAEYRAVVDGTSAPLAFLESSPVVHWSTHAPHGLYGSPGAGDLSGLWRAMR